MDVLMGLLAALCSGGTDFLVGINAKAVGVKKAVFFGQLVIMCLLPLCLPRTRTFPVFGAFSPGYNRSLAMISATRLYTKKSSNERPYQLPPPQELLE
jgi:hypothetical protein